MAITIFGQQDADPSALDDLVIAILGYGNQGRAHAMNLRDSGVNVMIGQRPGSSFDRARADSFEPRPVEEASVSGDLLVLALPDESAAEVFGSQIRPHLRRGQTLGFLHGFNIRFGFVEPPQEVDVILIAPKGPGTLLRSLYVDGKGLPALLAVDRDASGHARRTALAWAAGIGCTRAGVIETTFAAETETDLFGEQVVLCGGVIALAKAAFETLVSAGYEPEFAYLECVHELKQIVDLIYERGLTGMRQRVSNTAEYGELTRGPRLITDETRREMRLILDEIRSGAFAEEWIAEYRSGAHKFHKLHDADVDSAFEEAGRNVRKLMPWLGDDK